MTESIRILLADDDHLVRAAIRNLLEQEPGMEVVGEAADGEEAIARASALAPDVILLDLIMPRKSGLEAIAAIKHREPNARILVLTGFAADDIVFEAIKAGAAGYLLKTATVPELTRAVHSVHAGEMPLHPRIASKLIRELTHSTQPPVKTESLTKRELTTLRLAARGLSNDEIAKALSVSETTVRAHMTHILKKLQINSRTQAALYALKTGLVELDVDR